MQLYSSHTAFRPAPAPAGLSEAIWNPLDRHIDDSTEMDFVDNPWPYLDRLGAAAESGLPAAHYLLGLMYALGLAGSADYVVAYALFDIAARLGCRNAWPHRCVAAVDLAPGDILHARQLAATWMNRFHNRQRLARKRTVDVATQSSTEAQA